MKRKRVLLLLITGFTCLGGLYLDAQAKSLLSRVRSREGAKKNVPTVITSDSMDFDISKNVAVFTGNVQVDDANMRILCDQMIVRFEGKPKDVKKETGAKDSKVEKKDTVKSEAADDPIQSGTKVKTIECIKNVIIIRKVYDEKEKSEGEQKAVAGHALYEVKPGKITLTKNPALIRGGHTLRGEVIIYWVGSERVSVRSGNKTSSELKIRSNKK